MTTPNLALDATPAQRTSEKGPATTGEMDGRSVEIGCHYRKLSTLRLFLAVPLIYIPILSAVPFLLVSSLIVYAHLRLLGARNVKTYWDFVPAWVSHRYTRDTQITMDSSQGAFWVRSRLFWIFNCKLYCPLSVALVSWATYLVKLVENWWCPFGHERKHTYADARIDQSVWHLDPADTAKLDPEDRDNTIWNRDGRRD